MRWQTFTSLSTAIGHFLPIVLVFMACAPSLQAAIVITTDSEEPLLGYAVERPNGYVISTSNRSDAKTTLIAKDKIVEVIPTVSYERLAKLSAADPEGCFRYADELFAMNRDPEARDTAIRLYLIAGRAAPDKFARSAVLSLQRLAADGKAAKRVAAFGMMNRWITADVVVTPDVEVIKPPVPQELLKVLRPLKQGKKAAAMRAWKASPAAAEQLKRYPLRMTSEDMREALEADVLNSRQLTRIVALEVAIEEEGEPVQKTAADSQPWSGQLVRSKAASVRPLSWESLFDGIDPRDDQFRDGAWKGSR